METKNKKLTAQQIQDILFEKNVFVDKVSVNKGIHKVMLGFFYTHGYTAEKFEEQISIALPNAKIIESGEIWKQFNGGAPIERQSHWYVKFTI